ncbi:MAG: NapC/NirT family cytochrome c [Candidatus Acidiferrales bacterium]
MFGTTAILIALIVVSAILALFFLVRPVVAAGPREKILAFIALFILPVLCVGGGMSAHIQRSEQRRFCISCHSMQPYGRSLYVDNPNYIPAAHFQNHRVPANEACYACHADYAIYGPLVDKMRGLKRIYMQYVSTPPAHITIPGGFNNDQCLRCHAGARDFEGNPVHRAIMASLTSNHMSCVTSGCHDTVHDIASLGHVKFWSPGQ